MIFMNPFSQFNFPSMTGFCFGSGLSQALFGAPSFWYTPTIVQGFGFGVPGIFMSNPGFYGTNSVFMNWTAYDVGLNMYDTFTKSTASQFNTTETSNNTKHYSSTIDDYSSEKGERLALDIKKHAKGSKSQCARYVSNALERTGLSDGMPRGDAYQMSAYLRKNRNFIEISPDDVDWRKLPAGCILCYDKCSQDYSCKWGHIEITLGDGRAASDVINSDIKKPDTIFIPV